MCVCVSIQSFYVYVGIVVFYVLVNFLLVLKIKTTNNCALVQRVCVVYSIYIRL